MKPQPLFRKTSSGASTSTPAMAASAMAVRKSTSRTKPAAEGPRCDMCLFSHGHNGFTLQTCASCQLHVHENCYGQTPTGEKNPNWQCLACQSLTWDPVDGVRQVKRPRECVLCPYEKGTHAMHPLYDTYGPKGQHLVLDAVEGKGKRSSKKPRRLAWVHSICAFMIGSKEGTSGVVYHCDKDGHYDGDSEEETEDDDDDDEKASTRAPGDSKAQGESAKEPAPGGNGGGSDDAEADHASAHHFVINDEPAWDASLRHLRRAKCTICGVKDTNSLMIPVLCSAGDATEPPSLVKRRTFPAEDCFVTMHVGCAMWSRFSDDGLKLLPRRVYYYPGVGPSADDAKESEEDGTEPIACVYCTAHAEMLVVKKPAIAAVRPQQQYPSNRGQQLQQKTKRSSVTGGQKRKLVEDYPTTAGHKQAKRKSATTAATANPEGKQQPRPVDRVDRVTNDVIKAVRAAEKNGEPLSVATTRRKEHWKKTLALPKDEFKRLWAEVKTGVSRHFSSSSTTVAGGGNTEKGPVGVSTTTKKKASSSSAGASSSSVATGTGTGNDPNPWKDLFVPNFAGKLFEFTDWDSVEVKMDVV